VGTGKTTRLGNWCTGVAADGILAPVVQGRRHLRHIATGETRDLEDLSGGAQIVTVRRFTFNADVFAWARGILVDLARSAGTHGGPDHIVVDEVGPLELSGGGLEPAVSPLVQYGANLSGSSAPEVILVVRAGLVESALKHFGLTPDQVLSFSPD
jgi:nucleoside-triphosphatase THEP1